MNFNGNECPKKTSARHSSEPTNVTRHGVAIGRLNGCRVNLGCGDENAKFLSSLFAMMRIDDKRI